MLGQDSGPINLNECTQQPQLPMKPWMQSYQNVHDQMNVIPNFPNSYNRAMYYPGWTTLQGIQEGSQQITNTLSSTMAALSNFVQLVDTAVYSAWSSLTSLLALLTQLSSFHRQYVHGGLHSVQIVLNKIIRTLFAPSPSSSINVKRVSTIILGAALALAFLVKKALKDITKLEGRSIPTTAIDVHITHPFVSQNSKQISLVKGRNIRIAAEDIDSIGCAVWLRGWNEKGQCGFFPANYVTL